MNHPKYQKWTKILFKISGTQVVIAGTTMFCNWRAETNELYYITKSLSASHPGYYRVYPDQMRKIYAPPPRADGMAL
jgi:hypothetical protein